ncbi:MAG: hypothetical protein RL553_701 [Planctomycetota bacterium]|jgi:hyaluronoglucosaminidase
MKNSKDFLASYAKLLGFSLDVESIFNQSIPREGYQILGTDKRMILFSDLSGLRNGFNALCRSNFNDEKINKPSFGVRGVIEGFYGKPWSHAQRLRGLNFFALHNMNTYILAPKDDPWQRFDWRTPLSDNFLNSTKELIERGEDLLIDVAVCISPGLTVKYSDDLDVDALMVRYRQLSKIGVTQFGLLLDDIPWELQFAEDQARYATIAQAQADFANRVLGKLLNEFASAKLFACPLQYHGRGSEPYITEFGKSLDSNIALMWTGRQICSEYLETVDAKFLAEKTNKMPYFWDNYPVNDVAMVHQLHVGPIENRDPNLGDFSYGLVANPMEKFELSLLPLATIGDYLWDSANYVAEKSWARALSLLVKNESDQNSFGHFLRNCFESCLSVNPAPEFSKLLGDATLQWRTNRKVEAIRLLQEYSKIMKSNVATLRSPSCSMPDWISESERWLVKYEKVADSLAEIAMILERASVGPHGGLLGTSADIERVKQIRISLAQDPTRIFGDGLDLTLGELATELSVANQ